MADLSREDMILKIDANGNGEWVDAADVWREIIELERDGKPVTIRTVSSVGFVPFDDPKEWAKYAPQPWHERLLLWFEHPIHSAVVGLVLFLLLLVVAIFFPISGGK